MNKIEYTSLIETLSSPANLKSPADDDTSSFGAMEQAFYSQLSLSGKPKHDAGIATNISHSGNTCNIAGGSRLAIATDIARECEVSDSSKIIVTASKAVSVDSISGAGVVDTSLVCVLDDKSDDNIVDEVMNPMPVQLVLSTPHTQEDHAIQCFSGYNWIQLKCIEPADKKFTYSKQFNPSEFVVIKMEMYGRNAATEMLPVSVVHTSAANCNVKISYEDYSIGNRFRSLINLGGAIVGDAMGDDMLSAQLAAGKMALDYLTSICPTIIVKNLICHMKFSCVISPAQVVDHCILLSVAFV